MTTEEKVNNWIKTQHGTAGWEQKLARLVEQAYEQGAREAMNQTEENLRTIVNDLLWMAARYAHGRHTFAPSTIREVVRFMRKTYKDWEPERDETIEPPEKIVGLRSDYLDDIFNPEICTSQKN